LIILVFAEAAPKTLAALHPERIAYPAAMIYYPLLKILYPIVWLTNAAANAVLFLFGVRPGETELQALTREELRTVVHEAGGRIAGRYQKMLLSILDLEQVTVDDVMVPHNEIIGIDLEDDEEDIAQVVASSQHTRLPVYRDDIDQVVGVLHMRRLASLTQGKLDKDTIRKLLDEPYFVPEGTPLSVQLVQFQRRRQRIALVVDEYGDIQGIITLEDILEEIVGEFATDPGNVGDDIINEGDGTFLIDGAANIREINRTQDWHLPTEGPKTINGLILEALETIPDPNISLKIAGYPIEIVETDGNRIRSVRIGPRTTKHDRSI
jgi:Mg2+/Co2+ transporter CorB